MADPKSGDVVACNTQFIPARKAGERARKIVTTQTLDADLKPVEAVTEEAIGEPMPDMSRVEG